MKYVVFILILFCVPVFADLMCVGCHEHTHAEVSFDGGSCVSCHGGIKNTTRKYLAHNRIIIGKYAWFLDGENKHVQSGQKLMDNNTCRRCHIINTKGNNLASNVDYSIRRLLVADILDSIKTPSEQMPYFNFTEEQVTDIVNALLHNMTNTADTRYVEIVHISQNTVGNAYEKRCGGCHMLLSKYGSFGNRSEALFLSGLYNEFYPPIENERWNRELLSRWLDNPRKIKEKTAMPVILLTEEEKKEIMELFEQ